MSIDYGDDFEYARSRLNDTFVKLKDKFKTPVYVSRVNDETGSVEVLTLNHRNKMVTLKDLDLNPFKLGYVNCKSEATYLQRLPVRRYKQGLRMNSVTCKNRRKNVPEFMSPEMSNMLRDIYPSVQECIESVENCECKSKAFSKQFAVGHRTAEGYTLEYKETPVGVVNYVNDIPTYTLKEEFAYLAESLKETLDVG